jgi:hypothetical protein
VKSVQAKTDCHRINANSKAERDNQVAVFQGVDDVFLVFICRVFREIMEVVVVEKVITLLV